MTVPLSNLTATWNNAGTVFSAVQMNVTNTASAGASKLLDLQIGGASQFNVDKLAGINWPTNGMSINILGSVLQVVDSGSGGFLINTANGLYLNSINTRLFGSPDLQTFVGGTERLRTDSSGRTMIGGGASLANAFGNNARLQQNGASFADTTFSMTRWYSGNTGPSIYLSKSESDTIGTHTVVANNDQLGAMVFAGSDGTVFRVAAQVEGDADGTPGSADMPGRLVFSTTPDGSTTLTERLRIDSNGQVNIGGFGAASLYVGVDPNVNFANGVFEGYSADSKGPLITFRKTRSGSPGGTTTLSAGDTLGSLLWGGRSAIGIESGAAITAIVEVTPGASDLPTYLSFGTLPVGGTAAIERMRIDSAGRATIGGFANASVFGQSSRVQIVETGANYFSQTIVGAAANPQIAFAYTAGATPTTLTTIVNGDVIGGIQYFGTDGASWIRAADIRVEADGTVASTQMPGRIVFTTTVGTALGGTFERLRIDNKGNVIVNTAAISTSATDGFLYIPTCAGAPSGTPTSYTGRTPIVYDTTNHKFWAYDSGWKGVVLT